MKVYVTICKKWLAGLWFVGSALIFLIILGQTVFGHYFDKAEEAWRWFCPTVIPTLFLMISVFFEDTFRKEPTKKKIDRFIFILSLMLSIFYFIVVLITILIQPFTAKTDVGLLNQSNLWLAPIQGLVTASLGIFFAKIEQS